MRVLHAREAAAEALARGQALAALAHVGLDESPQALLLRGIAYAQIGDGALAAASLRRALDGSLDPLLTARIRAAQVELALDGGDAVAAAVQAAAVASELMRRRDVHNASMMLLVQARAEVFLGRLQDASMTLENVLARALPPQLRALGSLARAEVAVRSIEPTSAMAFLKKARVALRAAPHDLLSRSLDALEADCQRKVARIGRGGVMTDANLFDIEKLSRRAVLLVDACRRFVRGGAVTVPLVRRPVVFTLLAELARVWPQPVARDHLISRAFDVRRPNDSHRIRLRVELGRLRKLMDGLHAGVVATHDGYKLASKREVVVLRPATDDGDAHISILLGDGASWSARALSDHIGLSPRSVQRAVLRLVDQGLVEKTGSGRLQRYMQKAPRLASRMLLLGLLPARA